MTKTDYSNLNEKNIFDFCDDMSIIENITLIPKAEYLEYVKQFPYNKCLDLLELAEITDNKELEEAIKTQYKEYFDENIIID